MYSNLLFIFQTLRAIMYEFIVYDRNGSHVNITAFNSLEVDDYDIPPPIEVEHIQRIKLLQKAETHSVYFHTCLMEINIPLTIL